MILQKYPLDFQWPTLEPFIFCVHHLDQYPKGNGRFGPDPKLLANRPLGNDFQIKDGFRMYHGEEVPGFPVHPHRGFETITIVRQGLIDHADSIGAAGRYGEGDVQWMTAGRGVQHSEMFPLLHEDRENVTELFQIWLNLPRANKMAAPHFTMFWSEKIPQLHLDEGRVELTLIAGEYNGQKALPPPPDSWASRIESDIAIYLIKMKKGGRVSLPATKQAVGRMLYHFQGEGLVLNGTNFEPSMAAHLDSMTEVNLESTKGEDEVLILQAKSIGEPVVQHGPFVMNSRNEIIQTIHEYQETQFGGWPWPRPDMVHGPGHERFAKFPDGRIERP